MFQKGLAPILIILLIAVAIGGIYLVRDYNKSRLGDITFNTSVLPPSSNPTDETVNWKTYTNSKYNYQFRYPNDFEITEESTDKVYISNNLPPDPSCKGGGCNLGTPRLSIYFEHLNNPGEDAMSLDEYANSRRTSLLRTNNDQSQIEKIQKFGLDARFVEGTTEGYNHNYFIKPNPNLSFSISVIFLSKVEVSKYEDTANQILSTFKFQ